MLPVEFQEAYVGVLFSPAGLPVVVPIGEDGVDIGLPADVPVLVVPFFLCRGDPLFFRLVVDEVDEILVGEVAVFCPLDVGAEGFGVCCLDVLV